MPFINVYSSTPLRPYEKARPLIPQPFPRAKVIARFTFDESSLSSAGRNSP